MRLLHIEPLVVLPAGLLQRVYRTARTRRGSDTRNPGGGTRTCGTIVLTVSRRARTTDAV